MLICHICSACVEERFMKQKGSNWALTVEVVCVQTSSWEKDQEAFWTLCVPEICQICKLTNVNLILLKSCAKALHTNWLPMTSHSFSEYGIKVHYPWKSKTPNCVYLFKEFDCLVLPAGYGLVLALLHHPLCVQTHCPLLYTYEMCPQCTSTRAVTRCRDMNTWLRNSSEAMNKRHTIFCQQECYEITTRKLNHIVLI